MVKCSNCNIEGHNKSSSQCAFNMNKDKELLESIKPLLYNGEYDNILTNYNITKYKLKQLIHLIPHDEFILNINIKDDYLDVLIETLTFNCYKCNKSFYQVPYVWSNNNYCFECNKTFDEERIKLIDIKCNICHIDLNKNDLKNDFYLNELSLIDMINTNSFIESDKYVCSCCSTMNKNILKRLRIKDEDLINNEIKEKVNLIHQNMLNKIHKILE